MLAVYNNHISRQFFLLLTGLRPVFWPGFATAGHFLQSTLRILKSTSGDVFVALRPGEGVFPQAFVCVSILTATEYFFRSNCPLSSDSLSYSC
jgi:hypothetical protein